MARSFRGSLQRWQSFGDEGRPGVAEGSAAGIIRIVPFDFLTASERVDALKSLAPGNERGKGLEDLVEEMLTGIPGITVADRDVLSGGHEAELDLLLTNAAPADGLEAFGRDILVECKSSTDPLDSAGVNHFATQVKQRNLPLSLVVSLAGLTGPSEDSRAGHLVIRENAIAGHGILLIVEHELRAIRSPEHLVNVLERKRQKMVGQLRAHTFSDVELRELNPDKGLALRRGLAGIQNAIRVVHESAIREVIEAAQALPVVDLGEAGDRAESALQAVGQAIAEHRKYPSEDPMWRDVYDRVLEVGAAFLRLLDESLGDAEVQRIVSFDLNNLAPQRLRAHAGGELWRMLSEYYLRQARIRDRHERRSSAIAVVAMVVDEMIAINDIDPRDFYEDEDA
jgi:hypothetical protein